MPPETPDPFEIAALRSHDDVLARITEMLGFPPQDCVVMLMLKNQQLNGAARTLLADLKNDGDVDAMAMQLLAAAQVDSDAVLLVAFTDNPQRPAKLLETLNRLLGDAGITILDVIRADGQRRWSLMCADPDCCPPEGTPYDLSLNPFTLRSIVDGQVTAASEDELRKSVAQMPDIEATMEPATVAVMREIRETYAGSPPGEHVKDGKTTVTGLVNRYLQTGQLPDDAEVARLSVFISDVRIRDEAWLMMTRETAEQHVAFWRHVAQRAVDPFESAPVALLAMAAWIAGHGILARFAVERGMTIDPDYAMLKLAHDTVQAMVPPTQWDVARADLLDPQGDTEREGGNPTPAT